MTSFDNPEIRLDEHDRACFYCAKNEEGCKRKQMLVLVMKHPALIHCQDWLRSEAIEEIKKLDGPLTLSQIGELNSKYL